MEGRSHEAEVFYLELVRRHIQYNKILSPNRILL
jgi:hypothetical protein